MAIVFMFLGRKGATVAVAVGKVFVAAVGIAVAAVAVVVVQGAEALAAATAVGRLVGWRRKPTRSADSKSQRPTFSIRRIAGFPPPSP